MARLSHGKPTDIRGFGLRLADLPPPAAPRIDPRRFFEHHDRRLEIEIGAGKGTFLVQQAARHPEINYLGIEWSNEYFLFAADRLRRHGLSNARLLLADATEFLRYWCADAVAATVHLYYSDPWPKARHHKRRVIQDPTLLALHRVLTPGGELRLVTDHDELWSWYEDHAARHAGLFERRKLAAGESSAAGELVGTNYERKFAREGRAVHAMTLVRRG